MSSCYMMWLCKICEKSNNSKSLSKHMKSKSHGHKERDIVVVTQYEFIRRDKSKID